MAYTIALFHSALGLRSSVLEFAESLRTDGHTVVTPDLYDGRVFVDVHAGAAHRDAVGVEELSRRAHRAVADLPERIVYAGFSMGSASAEMLAGSRPGADAVRAAGERCDVHAYEEGGHLFADEELPDYSPASADLMRERVGQFLAGL